MTFGSIWSRLWDSDVRMWPSMDTVSMLNSRNAHQYTVGALCILKNDLTFQESEVKYAKARTGKQSSEPFFQGGYHGDILKRRMNTYTYQIKYHDCVVYSIVYIVYIQRLLAMIIE